MPQLFCAIKETWLIERSVFCFSHSIIKSIFLCHTCFTQSVEKNLQTLHESLTLPGAGGVLPARSACVNRRQWPLWWEQQTLTTVLYLELDGGRADEEQGVAVPDVHVQGVEGQVAQEPALLPLLQEALVHSELQLQARRRCTRRERAEGAADVQVRGLQTL